MTRNFPEIVHSIFFPFGTVSKPVCIYFPCLFGFLDHTVGLLGMMIEFTRFSFDGAVCLSIEQTLYSFTHKLWFGFLKSVLRCVM